MHRRQLRRRRRALGADSAKSAGSELRMVCAKAKARMRRTRDSRVGMSTLGKSKGAFCMMTGRASKMCTYGCGRGSEDETHSWAFGPCLALFLMPESWGGRTASSRTEEDKRAGKRH